MQHLCEKLNVESLKITKTGPSFRIPLTFGLTDSRRYCIRPTAINLIDYDHGTPISLRRCNLKNVC